jgi:hypothetical protein
MRNFAAGGAILAHSGPFGENSFHQPLNSVFRRIAYSFVRTRGCENILGL